MNLEEHIAVVEEGISFLRHQPRMKRNLEQALELRALLVELHEARILLKQYHTKNITT